MSNYDVSPNHRGGWRIKRKGAAKASRVARTQAEAEKLAKRFSANSGGGEVTIHGRDGRIRDRDTVKPGNDPFPPRDRVH